MTPFANSVSVETLVRVRVTWEGIAESESDVRSGFQGVGQHCLSIYKPSSTLNLDIYTKLGFSLHFHFYPQKSVFWYLSSSWHIFVSFLFILTSGNLPFLISIQQLTLLVSSPGSTAIIPTENGWNLRLWQYLLVTYFHQIWPSCWQSHICKKPFRILKYWGSLNNPFCRHPHRPASFNSILF